MSHALIFYKEVLHAFIYSWNRYWNCIDKCSVLKCALLGKVSERMNEKQIKLVIAGVTSVVGLFKVIVQHRGQVKKEKKYVQGDSERV